MAKMAKVLVLEQHSHFFTIEPVSISAERFRCSINPNRNVHNLYFPHSQEILFECIKKEQLPNRSQLACICTREKQRPFSCKREV